MLRHFALNSHQRNITIEAHGGTGGPGGQSGSGSGGLGGIGQGPQFHVSGTSHWTVHGATETVFSTAVKTKQRKLCPIPVPSFTGRQEILQEIHQYFGQAQETRLIFILHGLGGSGKSQLAFKFVQEAQVKKRFSDVFFIDATNEETADTDLKLLVPGSDNTSEAALSWLASNHNDWLIVFDNADDVELDIAKFFPPCTFGSILITTRNPQLSIHGVDSQVSNMAVEDASNLLLKLVGRKAVQDNKKELATAIVKELHCFALAVSQAGGYINAQGDFEGYLALYKVSRDRLLKRNDIQGQSQYNTAVYATWDLSYNKLNPAAKLLLQIFSQLHHEGITKNIFEKASLSELRMDDNDFQVQVNQVLAQLGGSNHTWDGLVFNNIVGELQAYSLIEQNLHDQSFNVHPLIQQWNNDTTKQDMGFIQRCALAIIAMSSYFNTEDFKYITTLLHHMTRLSPLFQKPIDLQISVWLAYIAHLQGRWHDTEILYGAVCEKEKQFLGEEHPATLRNMHNLALTYRKQGRWSDAEGLQVVVLENQKRLLGVEHPDTLISMGNLACTYRVQGRWSDAEELEVKVLEASKRLLGEDHPATLHSMNNIANTYWNQGRWSDSEELEVKVLEARKRLLGEEHPNTLLSISNLAHSYNHQGRWRDAEELEIKVLEARKRLLGEDHPHTLTSMNNLACTYSDQGRWSDAAALRVAVLEARKRLLGEEHPDTLRNMHNLALTYRMQDRWSDAEGLQVVVLENQKRLLGVEHPDTLISMGNLACTYRVQGQWSDAEELEVKVLEARKRLLGEEHPDTLSSMANLACTYSYQGRLSDAERLEVIVLENRMRLLGEEHPDTLGSMNNLATTYRDQGRWTDAEALQVRAVEAHKRVLGEEHPHTLDSMHNLAVTYRNQGRWTDAEGLHIAALESQKRLLGEEHPHTLISMNELAYVFEHQARYSEAKALRQAAQDIEQRKDAASKCTQIDKFVATLPELALPGAVSENPVLQLLHGTYTQNSKKPRKWKRVFTSCFGSIGERNIEHEPGYLRSD
ncbi:hypothetical protein R3P38DRAFT_932004 [Favolaschia claudopus]|uniref:TPR-like protein n=1 Tax=Favolaschia claudopus TaxID=2862362 RepID=A0AAW0BR34_9AGAR